MMKVAGNETQTAEEVPKHQRKGGEHLNRRKEGDGR